MTIRTIRMRMVWSSRADARQPSARRGGYIAPRRSCGWSGRGKVMVMPFGKWKDRPLCEVDAGYLRWALATVKLSSGLRAALGAELARRGIAPPQVPAPPPPPECPACGPGPLSYAWTEFRDGRRQVRRSCRRCSRLMGFAPQVPPYTTLADGAASGTALLDVLLAAADQGVELKSDGVTAEFADAESWRRASPTLRQRLKECRSRLGRLMGRVAVEVREPEGVRR